MEILDVGVLIELPNFKVVQLLGQVGELSHNVFHLSFVLDSRVLENGSVRLGNLAARFELHKWLVLHLLALEHKGNHYLHAESNDGLILSLRNVDLTWQC